MAFDTLLIFFKVIISESNSEIYFCTTEMLIFGRTYILSGRVEDESFLNQEHYCDNQGLNVIPYFIIVGHWGLWMIMRGGSSNKKEKENWTTEKGKGVIPAR